MRCDYVLLVYVSVLVCILDFKPSLTYAETANTPRILLRGEIIARYIYLLLKSVLRTDYL